MSKLGVFWSIVNKQRIEVYRCDNEYGLADSAKELVGEAYRADVESDWFIGLLRDGKMWNVGRVGSILPEVKQRKAILALLEAII